MIRRLTVPTDRPYDVVVGPGVHGELADLVPADASRVVIIHGPKVESYARRAASSLHDREVVFIEAPDSEQAKTVEFLSNCWTVLGRHQFTRSDLVIGFGGGATTDVAGFVAATWLRGVRLITVPTTVLGMVDAAVGGKTGINTAEGKNLVGAFHEPIAVLCDLSVLRTLPDAETRSGLAEIIKCGFIADPTILATVAAHPAGVMDATSDVLAELIAKGIAVKAATVATDLTETGADGTIGREALNYGHTLGHAIERQENYTMRHGEAISIGMVFAAELAHRSGRISAHIVDKHRQALSSVGLPTTYRPEVFGDLMYSMRLDKKTRGDRLRFVVLSEIGATEVLSGPDADVMRASYAAISDSA